MVNLIVACDLKNGIGYQGGLPWKCKPDLQRFRELTMGKTIIMGRKTYEGLPKLDGRQMIVITSKIDLINDENVKTCDNLRDAIALGGADSWIIGGGMLYAKAINEAIVRRIYITRIHDKYTCDTWFPNIPHVYKIENFTPIMQSENGVKYQYITCIKTDKITSEFAYLSLLDKILKQGNHRQDRTGTGTISTFGEQIKFDISDSVPALTTKTLAWKTCIKELLWFIKGDTNARNLQKQGVHIWDLNTTREFLDNRGLSHLPEGDIGAGYGFQWRHFGAEYVDCNQNYKNQGTDQLERIIHDLKHDPFSRRIFMSAWNPSALSKMALPPCHVCCQFYVEEDESGTKHLSCHMYQRSVDCFLGLPFNIFSYTVLTYILAKWCDMKPKTLVISTGDTHIYKDHVDQVKEQLTRAPFALPKLIVKDDIMTKSICELDITDFEMIEYNAHPTIKAKMSA